jgi:transposase
LKKNDNAKPKTIDYFHVPRPLWRRIRKLIPRVDQRGKAGRNRADNHAALDGIWYVLWTGCQWKAVHRDWFGVCSSTLNQRFQEWQASGVFAAIMRERVKFYHQQRHIKWKWQSLDAKACPAPLGGEATGKSPVDRAKRGSKIHLLVDQRGAPLAVFVTGANIRDRWSADDLIISIVEKLPHRLQQE